MKAERGKLFSLATAVAGLALLLAVGPSMKEVAIERWYLSRLDAPSFTERFRAARKLGAIRSTRAIPGIVALLRESHGHNAEAKEAEGPGSTPGLLLASILGEIGPLAVPALAQTLKETRGTGEYWRRFACRALGQIKAETAIPPLIELAEDQDACVRLIAFKTLGAMGARAQCAVPVLTRAIAAEGKRKGALHEAATVALETILTARDAQEPR